MARVRGVSDFFIIWPKEKKWSSGLEKQQRLINNNLEAYFILRGKLVSCSQLQQISHSKLSWTNIILRFLMNS